MGAVLSNLLRAWVTAFLRYFKNSDYLAGTFAMSAMGVARDGVHKLFQAFFDWLVRALWVSIRLEEKDAELVLAWLRDRPEVHTTTQLTLYSRATSRNAARVYEYEPEIQTTTRLRCSVGNLPKQFIWIKRHEAKESGGRRCKTVTVSLFSRHKKLLETILEQGREIQRRQMEKYLTVVRVYDYGKDHGLNWLPPQEKDRKQPGRSINSVMLPRCPLTGLDQAQALLEDAREFLDSELWYTERGIPYRRGYLLHGVPGGGKSSLIQAIASELSLPIYMLQLSSEQMTDDILNSLLQFGMHDPPTILLLEDVDLLHPAVLHRRNAESKERSDEKDEEELDGDDKKKEGTVRGLRKGSGRGGQVTLSGLLNALDGLTATTGRLLFMTTNARDRLDHALLRSGRIDYELEFNYVIHEQVERLFEHFYQDFRSSGGGGTSWAQSSAGDLEAAPHKPEPVSLSDVKDFATTFAKQVEDANVQLTSADIQRHLMKRKADPKRALRDMDFLLALSKPKPEAKVKEKTSSEVEPKASAEAASRKEKTEEGEALNSDAVQDIGKVDASQKEGSPERP